MNISKNKKCNIKIIDEDMTSLEEDYEEALKNIKDLQHQLEYLRSGEYLNQVKFERDFNEKYVEDLQHQLEDQAKETDRWHNLYQETFTEKEQLNSLVNSCQERIREQEDTIIDKNECIELLEHMVDKREAIIEEARKYITKDNFVDGCLSKWQVMDLLQILDKESDKH